MRRPFLCGKVHRVIVTEADLDYEGSLTLDQDLLDAAGLLPYQKVEIYNVTRGTRLSTYLIAGPRGRGDCCANGAAAHLCRPGDRVIIAAYAELDDAEIASFRPKIVLVGADNRDWRLVDAEIPFQRTAG